MTADANNVRERLPNRRAAEIRTFEFNGHKFTATIGRYPDGSPAEIFLNTAKTGSELDRCTRDGAILASLSLQCGVPVSTLSRALSRTSRGDPDSALCYLLDQLANESRSSVTASSPRQCGDDGDGH
jgi:hypothetical protein